MEGLEIYSEGRKDNLERIIEPPDNIVETIPKEIHPQPNSRFSILWLLAIIAPLFLIALWQGFQLHGIKNSLAELNEHIKGIETNYQHSMASITKELRSIEKSSTEIQSSVNGLVELSGNQGKTVRNLAKDIGDIRSRLNTLNNSVKERENNEDKEGNNK